MRASEFVIEPGTMLMGKLAKTGQIVRIIKQVTGPAFARDKSEVWSLIDTEPERRNKISSTKWVPADTSFEWVRPYLEKIDEISRDRLERYLDRANRQVDSRQERMARARARLNTSYEIYHAETPNKVVDRFEAATPADAQRYYQDYIERYESDVDYDLRLRRDTGIMEGVTQDFFNNNFSQIDSVITKQYPKEILNLLLGMFPNAKEAIVNQYNDEEGMPFSEWRRVIYEIDDYVLSGPVVINGSKLPIDPGLEADRLAKYQQYIRDKDSGRPAQYFRANDSDPRTIDFTKLPPITIAQTDKGLVVTDGNHRAFLAKMANKPLRAYVWKRHPNNHPNVAKIKALFSSQQGVAEGYTRKLNFDEIYGKYLKVTDNNGDPNKEGFSLVTPLNGDSWNWRERPEFIPLVKKKLNQPGFLRPYKYQQIIDAMSGKQFDPAAHIARGNK